MKISVMLTSYNLVEYIDASIESVVTQEMPCDWELLIGDDGSTDGTVEKIKVWIDKYPEHIKLFQIPRDSDSTKVGSRASRNRALLLEQASGDYLNYLDGDDCWLGTTKLKSQFIQLEDPANADCSCCAHNTEAFVIPEDRRYLLTNETIPNQKYAFEEYWRHYYFHTNTLLFRKECKEKLLDPLWRDSLNDNNITFLVLQYGKVLYLKDVWALYNMTGNGLWTGHKKIYGLFREMKSVDLQIREYPKSRNVILYRHYNSIVTILRTYTKADYEDVASLLVGLDRNTYTYTFLLSKTEEKSRSEKKKIRQLEKELRSIRLQKTIYGVRNKLKRLIPHK